MSLPWHSNMWSSRPALIKRLESIEGIYKVESLKEFKQVSDPKTRTKTPEDGTVYVLKDGFTPTATNNASAEQDVEIGYSLILAKYDPELEEEDIELEKLQTRILRSIQGFNPVDENGKALCLTPFSQRKPLPFMHDDGFSFYSFRFVTEVAILNLD